jgi:hypothetical protein
MQKLIRHIHFDIQIDPPKTLLEKLTLQRHVSYILNEDIRYFSARYGKWITVLAPYASDGASGPAEDVASVAWWVHDWICEKKRFDDGSYIGRLQRSFILHDILWEDGRYIRACTWFVATGCWSLITNNRV